MENNKGLEIFLNLIDRAECVIKEDYFSDFSSVNEYEVSDIKEKTDIKEKVPFTSLKEFNMQFKDCFSCNNCIGREGVYLGYGGLAPLAMFIGDGPGMNDRQRGKIFSSVEGFELLKWIKGVRLTKEEIYLTNIVKCLNVKHLNTFSCSSLIVEEVNLVSPKAVLLLGQFAARMFFRDSRNIEQYRNDEKLKTGNIPVTVTYHPRDVLKNPSLFHLVGEDLKRFSLQLGIEGRISRA